MEKSFIDRNFHGLAFQIAAIGLKDVVIISFVLSLSNSGKNLP
ncbi:hypothetical protein Godav_021389 [Gossypium davidsonii]|uniref:Uncharacterized protein n=2 Tax=Gossypium TaxID=3633 RepID=A0A7J8R685_GOSDV|nr:hypothetical protein [Gossypium davidsonii]MBA0644342.1 hypothetical protein [Gossypium klotzschianum]